MLSGVKSLLKRYPSLVAAYRDLHWRRVVLADWRDNVLGDRLSSGMTPLGFHLVTRNHPANRAMLQGAFEPEETAVLLQQFARTDVFVDVGANVGYYTLLALKHGKHAVAVEPQRRNLQCLYGSLEANGWQDRAEIFPVGLGARPGMAALYGASGPSASIVRDWAKYSSTYHQTIPVLTLDIVLADRFVDAGVFIKIDVEGYEYQVLQGASQTARRLERAAWLVEICFDEFHPSGRNPDFGNTFEWFWKHGYRAHTANSARTPVLPHDVERWSRAGECDSGTINYLFTKP
ncbi:MAG TPA: FkbM family methyltransferase [Burkholderiales bacterium]|nr:FkbM family methyltransferase [Burkholderiales bacterium]